MGLGFQLAPYSFIFKKMTGLDLQDVRLETLKGSLDSSNIAKVDHIFGSDFPTSATSALKESGILDEHSPPKDFDQESFDI